MDRRKSGAMTLKIWTNTGRRSVCNEHWTENQAKMADLHFNELDTVPKTNFENVKIRLKPRTRTSQRTPKFEFSPNRVRSASTLFYLLRDLSEIPDRVAIFDENCQPVLFGSLRFGMVSLSRLSLTPRMLQHSAPVLISHPRKIGMHSQN